MAGMASPLRNEFAGAVIMSWVLGNQGEKICADDPDREMWLATLSLPRVRDLKRKLIECGL